MYIYIFYKFKFFKIYFNICFYICKFNFAIVLQNIILFAHCKFINACKIIIVSLKINVVIAQKFFKALKIFMHNYNILCIIKVLL